MTEIGKISQALYENVCEREPNLEKIRDLLNSGADPNYRQRDTGQTPLHSACGKHFYLEEQRRGWKAILEELFQRGANIDAQAEDGSSPLHLACERGNIDDAKFLLERKANPNSRDKKGRTPIFLAFKDDLFDLLKPRVNKKLILSFLNIKS